LHFADERDDYKLFMRHVRCVPADDLTAEFPRSAIEAGIEIFDPRDRSVSAEADANDRPERLTAHGSDVAKISRHGFPPDFPGGIAGPVMNAFHDRVAGVEQIFFGVVETQYGAVVADALDYRAGRFADDAFDFANQAELAGPAH